ncbi:MAG: SLC13 family permease [Rhodospirillaceae bacterium]|nr:SLC13 family permease [Rhodospirillaceae bacterium]
MRTSQKVGLTIGIFFGLGLQLTPVPAGLSAEGWVVVSLAVLMVSWWVTEAIPIPVTSLLPLVVLPVVGVASIAEAAVPYSSPTVLLLMGGFIIAKSVERWNLHARIALNIVVRAGNHPAALVGGFMLASAVLSMWISNTATVIMLIPIAVSVSYAVLGEKAFRAPFTIALLLGVAYGASIGGLGTPVGTPTNLIVIGYLEREASQSVSFAQWMLIGIPTIVVMLPAVWVVLTRWGLRLSAPESDAGSDVVKEALDALGRISLPERRVLLVFGVIAAFWVLRRPLNGLNIFGVTPFGGVTDHVIAIAGAIVMFLVPSGSSKEPGSRLLDWDTAVRIPWGVMLLFGGGLSLAAAITGTGLATWLGGQMAGLTEMPLIVIMFSLVVFVIFSTELTSNVATASALLPVIGAIATAGGADPTLLAVPVAMAASCAFMLPMATGPNAIVFASGEVTLPQMATIGLRLNLLGVVLITSVVTVLVPIIFG